MFNRKSIWLIAIISCILVMCGYIYQDKLSFKNNTKMSPVILVPGSSASVNRFDKTIATINEHTKQEHSLLKIKVTKHNHLIVKGKIKPMDKEPFIVIGFENNKDGYKNIKKQVKQFHLAFNYVYNKYHFGTFKALGHSNGGLILTRWLEVYYNNYSNNKPRIKRLLTIGTPFNFEEDNLNHETLMLHDLIKNRDKLPSSLHVIAIGGTNTYDSDGIVPEGSYRCAKYIFQKSVKKFTMITLTGNKSEHSDLPQNQQVITLIEQHLMDDKNAKVYLLKHEIETDDE